MSQPDDSSTRPANLLGILIRYCEGDKTKEVWVDLDKVQALSWGSGEMDKKGKGNGNPSGPKLPKSKDPGTCPAGGLVNGGAPICWWTGVRWECGEAEA